MPRPYVSLPSTIASFALGCALTVGLGSPLAAQQGSAKADAVFPLKAAWSVQLEAGPAAGPAYDATRVFVALKPVVDPLSSQASPPRLVAIQIATGTTLWTREIGDARSVVAGNDLVYIASRQAVSAFAASDGQPRWQIPLDAPLSANLLYDGGWLIAVTEDSQVLAIRADNGAKVWQVHLPAPASAPPAIAGDGLYLGLTGNRVLRLELRTGAVTWDQQILSQPTTLLALEDRVFAGTNHWWFYALRPDNGRVLWRVRVGGAVVGRPAADRSAVWFLSFDNLLRALDRSGGSLDWRQLLVRRARFGPFPAGHILFVSGLVPTIQAYDSNGGTLVGTFDAPTELSAPLHVVPGLVERDFLVIALTGQGELLAVRPQSLDPEAYTVSPRAALILGIPRVRW